MNNNGKVDCTNLIEIFLTAEGFYDNYKNLRKQFEEPMGKIRYENITPVAAMNGFFAAELFLKTILAQLYCKKKWRRFFGRNYIS